MKHMSSELYKNAIVFVAAIAVVALAFVIVALAPVKGEPSTLPGTYVNRDLMAVTLYNNGMAVEGLAYPNILLVMPVKWRQAGDAVLLNGHKAFKVVGKNLVSLGGSHSVYVRQEVADHPEMVGVTGGTA